jgi:hypothetical protein
LTAVFRVVNEADGSAPHQLPSLLSLSPNAQEVPFGGLVNIELVLPQSLQGIRETALLLHEDISPFGVEVVLLVDFLHQRRQDVGEDCLS